MADSAYAKLLKQAAHWLHGAQQGHPGHNHSVTPFGATHPDPAPLVPGAHTTHAATATIQGLAQRARWPPLLRAAYLLVGDTSREFTPMGTEKIPPWTYLSADVIEERLNTYAEHGQHRICDLAQMYEGMGHFLVLALDMETGRVFQRHDGGGNGYAREHTWNFLMQLDLDTLDPAYFHPWHPHLPQHPTILSAYD